MSLDRHNAWARAQLIIAGHSVPCAEVGPGQPCPVCEDYAIRFLPVDERDPSPALYLAAADADEHGAGILTSVAADVWSCDRGADVASVGEPVMLRLVRDRLRADVVTLRDALADCGNVEPRP